MITSRKIALTLSLWMFGLSAPYCVADELRGRVGRDLQLEPVSFVLQVGSDSYQVRAADDAKWVRDGRAFDPRNLRRGDYVWVMGAKDDRGRTFQAVKIDVATVVCGAIKRIQEVVPLRLIVDDGTRTRIVRFSDDTELTRKGKKLSPGELRKNQHVWIASSQRSGTLVARNVEVVDMVAGEIVGIMEIFPLRLSVKSKSGNVSVQLREDTVVRQNSQRIDPGKLQEGDIIRVFGVEVGELFAAREIVVLAKKG